MAVYRKTALVEAEQFLPTENKIPSGVRSSGMGDPRKGGDYDWVLDTLEGTHTLRGGDYICTGPAGERWNVAREIFEATYDEVSRPQPVAETVEAREFIENWFAPWGSWKTAWWEMAVSDDVEMTDANALKALRKILAALRPSAHGEAG